MKTTRHIAASCSCIYFGVALYIMCPMLRPCCCLGVGLLTTGGTGFTSGDALCIASAVLFGVHKFRTETVTDRFKSSTRELVAVQLAVLAIISAAVCLPELADAAQGRSPGASLLPHP